MDDLTRRALAVDHALLALGHETFEVCGARFVRDPAYPRVYDANHVREVRTATPEAVEALLARADREFAHCPQRLVRLDADAPALVEAMLVLRGYQRSATLFAVLEGDVRGRAPVHDVRGITTEADWAAHAELKRRDWDEVAESKGLRDVADVGPALAAIARAKAPGVTWWLASLGGVPCGYLAAFVGVDGMGQVEDLYVTPETRHRGVATALLHRGIADCRARGAGSVVIVSDADDTPKHMYAAMGFRPLAVESKYLLVTS
jgi:GNAT superfamily N-acetyltransferase